ncbi:MAG: hypothetical protein HQ581_18685 [Planctomycetes bacterium]|nr:hypothetical protein [Planctomycetota bacterium]
MPTEAKHIASANRTQLTIAHLLEKLNQNSPWVATTAFYKAVHIVEAVFDNDKNIGHSSDHYSRENTLKQTRKYNQIVKHYLPLLRASIFARYLPSSGVFETYWTPENVVSQLLGHHLRQIEKSAKGFLSDRDNLDDIRAVLDGGGSC